MIYRYSSEYNDRTSYDFRHVLNHMFDTIPSTIMTCFKEPALRKIVYKLFTSISGLR